MRTAAAILPCFLTILVYRSIKSLLNDENNYLLHSLCYSLLEACLVEAMKIENIICAESEKVIKNIPVQEGKNVQASDVVCFLK